MLAALAQALADSPQTILQKIADAVLEALECDSTGLSLLTGYGRGVHWPAIAGAWRQHLEGGRQGDELCSGVLDLNAPLLLRNGDGHPGYLPATTPAVEEGLVVPFHVNGKVVGAIWAIAHTARRKFDAEDLRQLESLARFAAAAYQAIETSHVAADQRRTALALMEEAIHDRQALEARNRALRDSEQRFSKFMQHLPGLAWIKDSDGRYVYANDTAARAFQVPRAELYGKSDWDIFPPETAAQFTENDRRALSNESSIQTIESLEHASGIVHYSVVSKFAIPANDTGAAMVGGVAIDITDFKQTEEALRQSEATFRALAEASPGLIWRLDPNGRFVYVNPRCLEFFGKPAEALLGAGWQSLVHPEDAEAYLAAVAHAQRERQHLDDVVRARDKGDAWRWLECHALPLLGTNGEYAGHVGFSLDITERTLAERESARLAAVVESPDDAIVSKDLDGVITSWNAGAQRLFGYTAEEAIGRPITLLIPAERHGDDHGVLDRIRRGESVDHFETVRRRKDGTLVDVSLTVSPIRNPAGQIIGASKIARDISESKQAAEMLRQADRRKDEFLAMLAHELRNPLAPILVSLELLRRANGLGPSGSVGVDGQENDSDATEPHLRRRATHALEVLQRQVGQMVRLVDDLLDAGRISRGKIELRKERVELASIVHQAVEVVRPLAEIQCQELTVALPEAPLHLHADPARLAQIVGNLLNNACKFTDRGGHIWLTVEHDRGPRNDETGRAQAQLFPHVVIRVRDTGIGIAADQLPRVFEMFTQVDTSLERPSTGLGIGLTLVKTLTVMHGGTVEARSDGIGEGSEFVVRLPILAETAAPPFEPPTEAEIGTLRILIVDDNRDAAESLDMLLKLTGHDVYSAHDGLTALEAATQLDPDVILLDLGLPLLNGYEVARRIRQRQGRGGRPVLVAVTGWGQDEDRRRSEQAGFDAHMVKPVDAVALRRLLFELGAGKQIERN